LSLGVDCKFDISFDIESDENCFPQLHFPQVAYAVHFSQINTSNFFDLIQRLVLEFLKSISPKVIGIKWHQRKAAFGFVISDTFLSNIIENIMSKF